MFLILPGLSLAAERFPPPDFTDHAMPKTTTPLPQTTLIEYLDVGALVVGLILASWLSLAKRSRRWLFWLAIFSIGYFGFYREGCVCAIGSIQNIALALFDASYAIPLFVVGFFVLPIAFTLFFGRSFCSSICPHGALQEVVLLKAIKLPRWLTAALGLFPFIYLGLAVLFAATGCSFIICQYDPFVPLFRLSGSFGMLLFGGGLLLLSLFVARPYCRFLCPLGAIFRLISPLSKYHVKIYPDHCINCRLCEQSCPVDAIHVPDSQVTDAANKSNHKALLVMFVLLPILMIGFGYLFGQTSNAMARLHPTVKLAERLTLEDQGIITESDDATEAFRALGKPTAELYDQANAVRVKMGTGTWWFGAWVGLVIGFKSIQLALGKKHLDYEADRSRCVSCGRCFEYCPNDPSCKVQIDGVLAAGQLVELSIEKIENDTAEQAGPNG